MLSALLLSLSALAGPHADQAALAEVGALVVPPLARSGDRIAPLPPLPSDRPEVRVYGYLAYWADDLDTLRWDALTDVALFAAAAGPDGSLTGTARWGDVQAALERAEPLGIRVHLCVTNFDTAELRTLLGSPSARTRLIDALVAEVDRTGAHGVNIDFEGVPGDRRAELVTFTRDLAARVPEVVLATPAVDWSDAWDYGALTDHADLFVMGYGYHWSGSDFAGPVDPLYGRDPWSAYALDWTVADYKLGGADPDRVILGLPLYGYAWTTAADTVPARATARGEVVFYTEGAALIAAHGRRLDAATATPWTWDGRRQAWFSDAASVQERTAYTVAAGLGGVGFWALNYDGGDDALWDGVREVTNLAVDDTGDPGDTDAPDDTDTPEGDALWRADAGDPFIAYVGERVQLSAEWSTGPEPLVYRWTQVQGPPVTLTSTDVVDPLFTVAEPGVHVFEVVVGDGEAFSVPARSTVLVADADLARAGCGCSAAGRGGYSAWALALLVLVARRRRR